MSTQSSAEFVPTIWSESAARPTFAETSLTPGMARSSRLARLASRSISVSDVPGGAVQWSTRLRSRKDGRDGASRKGTSVTPIRPIRERTSKKGRGALIAAVRTRSQRARSRLRNAGTRRTSVTFERSSTLSAGVTTSAIAIEARTAIAYP